MGFLSKVLLGILLHVRMLSACDVCTDVAPTWFTNSGYTCEDYPWSSIFTSGCANSDSWTASAHCEQRCYEEGVGYDGLTCCDRPTAAPTLSPTVPQPSLSPAPTPMPYPTPAPTAYVVNCAASVDALDVTLASLDATVSGQRVLIDPAGGQCNLTVETTLDGINDLEIACWSAGDNAYCNSAAIGVASNLADIAAALQFKNCNRLLVRGILFNGLGVKHQPSEGGGTTVDDTTYLNCTWTDAPDTSLNFCA